MKLTDETLLNYADGLLDEETADIVAKLLETDQVASERLRLIQLSGSVLETPEIQQAFPGIPKELENKISNPSATQTSNHLNLTKQPSFYYLVKKYAAILIIALSCFGSGYYLRSVGISTDQSEGAIPTWIVRVVDYHTLYGRETVSPARTLPDEVKKLQQKFSEVLGHKIVIPNLGNANIEFRRGQILKFHDQPIVQLSYLPANSGKPIALCLKAAEGKDTAPHFFSFRGLGVVLWREKNIDYVLVGQNDRNSLLETAQKAILETSSI